MAQRSHCYGAHLSLRLGTQGAFPQKRLPDNAPRAVSETELGGLYAAAMSYW